MANEVQGVWTTNYQPTSTGVTSTQSPAIDNNEQSGLNAILGISSQIAQIGGAIAIQRQQSGASANRQSRIAQCGRRPLFGGVRKVQWDRCVASMGATAPVTESTTNVSSEENKSMGGGSSTMKFVFLGVGILALGAIGFLALRKK